MFGRMNSDITTQILAGDIQLHSHVQVPRVVTERIQRFFKPMYPCSWFETETHESFDQQQIALTVIEHVGDHIYRYTTRFDPYELIQ